MNPHPDSGTGDDAVSNFVMTKQVKYIQKYLLTFVSKPLSTHFVPVCDLNKFLLILNNFNWVYRLT